MARGRFLRCRRDPRTSRPRTNGPAVHVPEWPQNLDRAQLDQQIGPTGVTPSVKPYETDGTAAWKRVASCGSSNKINDLRDGSDVLEEQS